MALPEGKAGHLLINWTNSTNSSVGNTTNKVAQRLADTAMNDDDSDLYNVEEVWFLLICTHMFYLMGIPGNIMTLIVLQRKTMKDNFVSFFLSAVCVVDLWCLLTGFDVYWYIAVTGGTDVRNKSYKHCLYHWMVTLTGLQINEWLIVIVSVTRIYHLNHSRDRLSTGQNTLQAIVIVCGVFIISLVPSFFVIRNMLHVHYENGQIEECHIGSLGVMEQVYFGLTLILPPLLVIVLNHAFLCTFRARTPDTMKSRGTTMATYRRLRMQMIFTDVMFFVTSVPTLVLYNIYVTFLSKDSDSARIKDSEIAMLFCLLYSGFTFNVFIFCCFGRRFRAEIKNMILKPLHTCGFCTEVQILEAVTARIPQTPPAPFSIFTQTSSTVIKGVESNGAVATEDESNGANPNGAGNPSAVPAESFAYDSSTDAEKRFSFSYRIE